MQHHNMDYAMLPPVLWSNMDVPWELRMEEYPKLWQNSTYTTWKAGCPGVEVGLAMIFVSMSHREFDSSRLALDIADTVAIWYPASRVDDIDNGDKSTGEVAEDHDDEDDSNDEDVDEDLHKTVTEIATKTDDSSFCSDAEDNTWLEEVTGSSFDTFIKECADRSGVGELMGGQNLLLDYTMVVELKQLHELANELVSIACHFDTKFSDTAFALLQKIHEAFIGTSSIAQKFVDDMATIALNFISDTTAYETELSASDGMAFTAGLARIRGWIAEMTKEASALELTYEGAQKKFAGILE